MFTMLFKNDRILYVNKRSLKMANLKLKTISNEPREGTSQFIWDRLIVVIDKNTGAEVNSGYLGANVVSHKQVDYHPITLKPSKYTSEWIVTIWNGPKEITKTFYNRKESNAFIKEQLLS